MLYTWFFIDFDWFELYCNHSKMRARYDLEKTSIVQGLYMQHLSFDLTCYYLVLTYLERTVESVFSIQHSVETLFFSNTSSGSIHTLLFTAVLPAFGVVSETVTSMLVNTFWIYRYCRIICCNCCSCFLVWGHHLFLSGQSGLTGAIFLSHLRCHCSNCY